MRVTLDQLRRNARRGTFQIPHVPKSESPRSSGGKGEWRWGQRVHLVMKEKVVGTSQRSNRVKPYADVLAKLAYSTELMVL